MKKIIILSFLFFLFSFTKDKKHQINFQHGSWQEIFDASKNGDQLIFVDCYATWCGPCKSMAKKVFTDSIVGTLFNEKFINYKLNMETPEGRLFAKKYPITGYPTMFFINNKGNVVHKVVGKHKSKQLVREANIALEKAEKM